MKLRNAFALAALALAAAAMPVASAANRGLDEEQLALTWHKISGKPFDFERAALMSGVADRVSGFDRPDVLAREAARLRAVYDAGSETIEFATEIRNSISEYDHAAGEFTIAIFEPGAYMPVHFQRQEYRVVFANGAAGRAIAMPKEEARQFDRQIMRSGGRAVVTPVRFRVIGEGDPNGAVDGLYVIRAEILEAKTIDTDGTVLASPQFAPFAAAARVAFSARDVDVGGLRVGVKADELEAAITRLYGKPMRADRAKGVARGTGPDARFAGTIELDAMRCLYVPTQRRAPPKPGDVCLQAKYDENEIVRQISIQRIFPRFDYETARRAAIARYGPAARGGGALAWGPIDAPEGHALTLAIDPHGNSLSIGFDSINAGSLRFLLTDTGWERKP